MQADVSPRRVEAIAAWLAAVVAAGAFALGLVGPHLGGEDPGLQDTLGFLIEVINAMWLQGGVLAVAVALVVALRRRWWPATLLAAVAAAILLPDLWARVRAPALLLATEAPRLRIATANLAEQNTDDPSMLDALRGLDADVLVLPEYTVSWERRLGPWLATAYPHRWLALPPPADGYRTDGFRLAVCSRIPATGEPTVVHVARVVAQLRVPLRWQGRDFALYGIHPRKGFPAWAHPGAWRDRCELLDWFAAEDLPMVIAGDFNATPRSALFARLRGRGLRNASQDALGAAPATWPTHPAWQAPFRVAIDHVVHSAAFRAVGFRTGAPTNSDHAMVVAELVWSDR